MSYLAMQISDFISIPAVLLALMAPSAQAQDPVGSAIGIIQSDSAAWIVGHPFSAIKYAWRVRVLPDGKQQFIRNDHYPIQIARDAIGRLRMQQIDDADLDPACDQPTKMVPPPCPAWSVFVVDPGAQTVSHWPEGEFAAHITLAMPLSQSNLERTIRSTSELPEVPSEVDLQVSSVSTANLGGKLIDGVTAYGVRTTVVYPVGYSGDRAPQTRIHEVWTAPDLKLIIRVVDGDPQGFETIWGLRKISLHPDPSLFQAPIGYQMQHQISDVWAEHDFDSLESWFAK